MNVLKFHFWLENLLIIVLSKKKKMQKRHFSFFKGGEYVFYEKLILSVFS